MLRVFRCEQHTSQGVLAVFAAGTTPVGETIYYPSPMSRNQGPVSELLLQLRAGDRGVMPQLVELIYHELRLIARARLQAEKPNHSLTPTALVHEAYLRLASARELQINDRAHFMAVAAQAMRRVLVDHARSRLAACRGGGAIPIRCDEMDLLAPEAEDQILALDEALDRLAKLNPRQAQVVELRYFAGLTEDEVASALGVNRRTVNRDWRVAKTWLYAQVAKFGGSVE